MEELHTFWRLGNIMLRSGLINQESLDQSIAIAREAMLPIGQVLVMSGHVTPLQLRAALQAQALLKDRYLDMPTVIQAMIFVSRKQISLREALTQLGWEPSTDALNRLGDLLAACGKITNEQLETALLTCHATGLTLGQVLVSQGILPANVIQIALRIQKEIRAGTMKREQGIERLCAA